MKKEFKEGCRYLVKDKNSDDYYSILELTVLEVSNKAVKVKFENGNTVWYPKDHLLSVLIEELPSTKQIIKDKLHEMIQFEKDAIWYESDEPQFTLRTTEENDGEIILKAKENSKLKWEENPSKELMTWDEAMNYAKSLGDGWRLPTIEELKEAYKSKVKGFYRFFYWSSSTCSQDTSSAWVVAFNLGPMLDSSKTSSSYIRCVRDIK